VVGSVWSKLPRATNPGKEEVALSC